MAEQAIGLWNNPSFVRLWSARTISSLGSQIAGTAIPLTAAITLQATPGQMAFLVFAGSLPDLLFGLLAGVWVDRVRRRPLLMFADIGRAALLLLVPLSAITGHLSFALLWAVAFGCASLSLVFALASVALLPAVVRQDQLVEANGKLYMSEATISLIGPGLGGLFIQLVSAPRALLLNAGTFLASAWALGGVGQAESPPARDATVSRMHAIVTEVREGLRELIRTPLLRALALSMGIIVVGSQVNATVSILYMTRTLGFSPVEIGILAAMGGLGALMGAWIAGRVSQHLSTGHAIVVAGFTQAAALFLIPLAAETDKPLLILTSSAIVTGLAYSVLSVNQISLRQRITPNRLLGRVTAARRFLIFSMSPVGAGLGGWLGTTVGFQQALVCGAAITLIGALCQAFSPIRSAK